MNATATAPRAAHLRQASPTKAPAVPARAQCSARVITAARPTAEQESALYDLLDQAKTICTLIAHNFGGDGSFEDPSAAPGIAPLFACVTDLMRAADKLATDLDVHPAVANKIEQAHGLAEHLLGMSEERWFGDDRETRIFRLGDVDVSMGYWTIEKLIKSAMDLPMSEVQA